METTSLALITRPAASLGKPTQKDRNIWLLKKRGRSDDELATLFGVGIDKIRQAYDRWDLHVSKYDNIELDRALVEVGMEMLPQVKKSIAGALTATKLETVTKGKKVIQRRVADRATQLKAVATYRDLMEVTRPKGVGVQVNTQINNPGGDKPSSTPKGFDFESRLRMIRADKGLSNDDAVQDGEFEDVDPDESLSNELAEIGIEIDDEEDEDEDEENEE